MNRDAEFIADEIYLKSLVLLTPPSKKKEFSSLHNTVLAGFSKP